MNISKDNTLLEMFPAKENTSLPDIPDYKKIEEFRIGVNEKIVKGR